MNFHKDSTPCIVLISRNRILSINTRPSFPGGSNGKETTCNAGDPGSISGWGSSLEKGMALLAWRIPWIEEPGHKHLDTTE